MQFLRDMFAVQGDAGMCLAMAVALMIGFTWAIASDMIDAWRMR